MRRDGRVFPHATESFMAAFRFMVRLQDDRCLFVAMLLRSVIQEFISAMNADPVSEGRHCDVQRRQKARYDEID